MIIKMDPMNLEILQQSLPQRPRRAKKKRKQRRRQRPKGKAPRVQPKEKDLPPQLGRVQHLLLVKVQHLLLVKVQGLQRAKAELARAARLAAKVGRVAQPRPKPNQQ